VVGEPAQEGRGSDPDAAGAAKPLGRRNGLTLAAIRREEVEELGRLGNHRCELLVFDESRRFETYRTHSALVKQNMRNRGIIAVTVR
jgi:hypothetical protein